MILVQFLAEMFLVSDTNLRWQIPETFSIFGRSLSGIYWRGMGGTVFVQPVRYLSKQILWKSSYQYLGSKFPVGYVWHWAWSCFVLIRRRLKVYDASSLSQKLHKPHLGWGLLHNCCIFRIVEMLASFLIRIISRNWGCGKNFWRMLPNSPMFAKALKYITVWWGGALPHTDFKVHKRKMMKF